MVSAGGNTELPELRPRDVLSDRHVRKWICISFAANSNWSPMVLLGEYFSSLARDVGMAEGSLITGYRPVGP